MALPPITPAADWSAEVGAIAVEQMNGRASIWTPGTAGRYDPVTDARTGDTAPVAVIGPCRARIQKLSSTRHLVGKGLEGRTAYRIQFELLPGAPLVPEGSIARIEDGGANPLLAGLSLQVVSALGSSHAALLTVECVTEG